MHPAKSDKQLKIRKAWLRDSDDLMALLEQLGHPSEAMAVRRHIRRSMKRHSDRIILVADLAGQIVGFMALCYMDAMPYPKPWLRITALCVKSSHRGKGIGRALEKAALDTARRLVCGFIEVSSSHSRKKAHRFYSQTGYKDTHRFFTKPVSLHFVGKNTHGNSPDKEICSRATAHV